jgi:hypothetical protein
MAVVNRHTGTSGWGNVTILACDRHGSIAPLCHQRDPFRPLRGWLS